MLRELNFDELFLVSGGESENDHGDHGNDVGIDSDSASNSSNQDVAGPSGKDIINACKVADAVIGTLSKALALGVAAVSACTMMSNAEGGGGNQNG